MPCKVEWPHDALCVRWTGTIDAAELVDLSAQIVADSRFDSVRWALHDFRACEGMTVTSPPMGKIAEIDLAAAITNPSLHIAVVTTMADVRTAFSVCVDSAINRFRIDFFDSIDAAQVWLLGKTIRS
jgi:hypothetical protein